MSVDHGVPLAEKWEERLRKWGCEQHNPLFSMQKCR